MLHAPLTELVLAMVMLCSIPTAKGNSLKQSYATLYRRKRACIWNRRARTTDPVCKASSAPAVTDRDLECYASRYDDLNEAGELGHVDHLRSHWRAVGYPEGRHAHCTDTETLSTMTCRAPEPSPPTVQASQQRRPRHPECLRLAPQFHFDPPIDSPERLGYQCTLAVVTALFGTDKDMLPEYSELFQRSILQAETGGRSQQRSCWFAFTNRATVEFGARNRTASWRRAKECMDRKHALKMGIWNIIALDPTDMPFGPESHGANSRVPKLLSHCVLRHSVRRRSLLPATCFSRFNMSFASRPTVTRLLHRRKDQPRQSRSPLADVHRVHIRQCGASQAGARRSRGMPEC